MEEIKMNYEYLEHHGILGQKWGVRRYQNKDGNYTSLGARRYAKAAQAAQRDADDLRKHGYTKEADAVQKVADKNRAKANKKQEELNKRLNSEEFTSKDVRIARKAIKKTGKTGDNYSKAVKEAQADLKKVANSYGDDKAFDAAFFRGKKAIQRGLLMDVGYSKEKAEKGADWLEKHGWNLTFTDTLPLHDESIYQYDEK